MFNSTYQFREKTFLLICKKGRVVNRRNSIKIIPIKEEQRAKATIGKICFSGEDK